MMGRLEWRLGLGLLLGVWMALAGARAVGQAKPTASALGFSLPDIGGSLRYSVSTSESVSRGLYSDGGVASSTNFSGNVAFLTNSKTHPFNMVYSGGYLLGNTGEPSPFYQNLALFQTLEIKRWQVVVSDAVNYLPEAATTGLSGVPGQGDLNTDPVGGTGVGILTTYGPRVGNSLSVSTTRVLGRYTAQGSGSYTILRYLGTTGYSSATVGIDSTTEGGSGGVDYYLNARNSVGASYNYTQSSFSGSQFSFASQGVNGKYTRHWTRRLVTTFSGGPLRVSGQGLSAAAINVSVSASASYTGKELTSSVNYLRGTGSGGGVIPGAISDTLQYTLHRSYGREWGLSGTVGYAHTKSLPNIVTGLFTSEGVTASGQVSRALNRSLSAFASYTIEDQSVTNPALAASAGSALSGIYQVASFGLTFSPGAIRVGAR